MAPIIERIPQRSDEWKALHIGKPTASNFHKILTPVKLKISTLRRPYMFRLIAERLAKQYLPDKAFTGDAGYWINRGTDMEPKAVAAFEREHNMTVEPIGFVMNEEKTMGCSPDGLIVGSNEREAIEIKAPAPWTHVAYLLAREDEETWQNYRCQVQGQILIGHFDVVHFYSFFPGWPSKYVPTTPDFKFIALLHEALDEFVDELDREEARARELGTFEIAW